MDEPIEEAYFNWLYSKVARVDNPTPSLTFLTLMRDLHSTEFVFLISGDDNRAEDGLDLRREFLRESFTAQAPNWMDIPCSVLEMFIAFSRKAHFEADAYSSREWFWIFLGNLSLDDLNDASDHVSEIVSEVIDQFVWRTYRHDGYGGMFPLQQPKCDQRDVEIWYQFSEYLVNPGRL